MTPQQLIERAANQAEVTVERLVRVHGPTLRHLLASRPGMPLTELVAHPDQHTEVRRFKYGHQLGRGVARESLEAWQSRHPSVELHPDVVELLTHVDGIHLWADLDRGRAHYGILPLSEWVEVDVSEWRGFFDEPQRGAVVISYHGNGDYFLVLETRESRFTWYDPRDIRDTRTVQHSVSELLDWWWKLAQNLNPALKHTPSPG